MPLGGQFQINLTSMLFKESAMKKQITSDFQAHSALVKTCLYYATKQVPGNVADNRLIAPLADIWRPDTK